MALETWSIIIGIVLGGGAILGWVLKKARTLVSTWGGFMRDWEGEEAKDGRDSVPGVMQRLNKLDGELSHNGGKSLKDLVSKIEKRQTRLEGKMEEAEITRQQNHIIILEAIKTLSTQKDKR
jgi:hypothetical protein